MFIEVLRFFFFVSCLVGLFFGLYSYLYMYVYLYTRVYIRIVNLFWLEYKAIMAGGESWDWLFEGCG